MRDESAPTRLIYLMLSQQGVRPAVSVGAEVSKAIASLSVSVSVSVSLYTHTHTHTHTPLCYLWIRI